MLLFKLILIHCFCFHKHILGFLWIFLDPCCLEEFNVQNFAKWWCVWNFAKLWCCVHIFFYQKSEKGIQNRFLLLKHSSLRPNVAFPGRAVFLHSGEGCLHLEAVQYYGSSTWKYNFLNNHSLFLLPNLNKQFSSHVSSLYDSSEISVPLSAIFLFHLFIE